MRASNLTLIDAAKIQLKTHSSTNKKYVNHSHRNADFKKKRGSLSSSMTLPASHTAICSQQISLAIALLTDLCIAFIRLGNGILLWTITLARSLSYRNSMQRNNQKKQQTDPPKRDASCKDIRHNKNVFFSIFYFATTNTNTSREV